jgi:trimethylamine:corrinoid methyltransferase-like protein
MGSYAQMVVDNEFANSIFRVRNGIKPDPDACEVIAAAMGSTRNYLSQKHTMRWLRSGEINLTKLAERGSWESWVDTGRAGMLERAQAEAERILREHIVPPLDFVQERELDRLLNAAERELT